MAQFLEDERCFRQLSASVRAQPVSLRMSMIAESIGRSLWRMRLPGVAPELREELRELSDWLWNYDVPFRYTLQEREQFLSRERRWEDLARHVLWQSCFVAVVTVSPF